MIGRSTKGIAGREETVNDSQQKYDDPDASPIAAEVSQNPAKQWIHQCWSRTAGKWAATEGQLYRANELVRGCC